MMPQVNYLVKNIVVDSTGAYQIGTIQYNNAYATSPENTGYLFKLSGQKILDGSGKFVSTYNTGESFSISGWLDYASKYKYLYIGDILSRTIDVTSSTGVIGEMFVSCPPNGTLTCDFTLTSRQITNGSLFGGFNIYGTLTGLITTDACMFVNGDSFRFYQSYEALLTGGGVTAFIDDRYPNSVSYIDNDTSQTNNTLTFDYQYNTTFNDTINAFSVGRTGLYNSGMNLVTDLNVAGTGFSGLFNGIWSGTKFIYLDSPSTMNLNYSVLSADSAGNIYPSTGYYEVDIQETGKMMRAEYITGFSLTTGGEYMAPPLILVSGYYYSTGIQQSIYSLLFSSGCTGNIDVTFSGGGGSGASGLLSLNPVLFSGVYFGGIKWFNTVYQYTTTNIGTGYLVPPRAYVNTGKYGAGCFDVPRTSGYNQAWFAPFDTSGTLDIEAGWFTGISLCQTGIVGAGLTGYIVTGIDVYNIGTGYSKSRPPYLVFIRTGTDSLIKNASGILTLNTGSLNQQSNWLVSASIAGATASVTGLSGIVPLGNNSLMAVNISCSGVDITQLITGTIKVSLYGYPSAFVSGGFFYNKYYDTSPTAIKKKDNPISIFAPTSDLNFLLTQTDLDTIYSDISYTNNTWPYQPGDFDF